MVEEKEVRLKVGELTAREEAGRGIVRLDSNTMGRIGIKEGDVVEIEGSKKTGAIAVRAYPADVGLNLIRMDGIIRRNCGTGVGEFVKIRKADVKEARSITLAPAQKGIMIHISPNLIKQNIFMRPMVKGDVIVPSPVTKRKKGTGLFEDFFGFDFEDLFFTPFPTETRFVVTATEPGGIVQVGDITELEILPQLPESMKLEERAIPAVTYEDVGGIKEIVHKVREMIELPLRHPELFERLGIEPPKGVLLYGPPGCGKTLLAKAVANESGANFISISGPEVTSKWYGESEKRIRDLFDEAEKNAPSIIFIDEIDALAPKREEVTGEVERRMVSQLLTCLDGMKKRGKVIVIAATNRVNSLDTALRRAGRFDREIEFPVPDRNGRLEILKIHTRNMPLKEVDLNWLADITYGYVGADIWALCKEAAMSALRRVLPEIKWKEEEELPKEVMEKLIVTKEDFENALKMVEPSAMREVLVEIPKVKWGDVGGLENVKEALREMIEWPLKSPESFERVGITPPRGILLYGPPGCGKTLLAKAVANESGANFISVKGPEMLCISANTRILTNRCGLQPINVFYKKILPISELEFKDDSKEIRRLKDNVYTFGINSNGTLEKTKITRINKLFVPICYSLEFSNNSKFTASGNQPLLVFRDNDIKWIRIEEIREEELIATPSELPVFSGEVELQLPNYKHLKLVKEDADDNYVKIITTKTITKLPKRFSEDLAEFLGWFVADGNISKEGISICNKNEKHRRRIYELFKLFVEERVRKYKDRIITYSTPLTLWLKELFGMKINSKKSHTIHAPASIFKASKNIIASFLRGVYNGDGHVGKTRVEYGTKSKRLAEDIVYMLTMLGIKSRFWKRKDSMFMITISGKKEIQIFKNIVLGYSNNVGIRKHYNAQYKLPDVSQLLRDTKIKLDLHYGNKIPEGLFEGVINRRSRCGLIRLQRIMKYIKKYATPDFRQSDTYKVLELLSTGRLNWVKIQKKKQIEPQWMYDIETENSSFIGGELPMILHNSKWVGESEQRIRELFRRARQVAPSIVFLDEVDALVPRRGLYYGTHVTESVVSQLLTEISGLEELKNVVIIAASNRPDMLDPALLRPGRIDRFVLIPAPDEKTRLEILKVHTKNMPLKQVNLKEMAKRTEGFSGADLEALCREAAMSALRENIKAKEVREKHFEDALKKITPSITKEVVDYYNKFVERQKKVEKEEKEIPKYIG